MDTSRRELLKLWVKATSVIATGGLLWCTGSINIRVNEILDKLSSDIYIYIAQSKDLIWEAELALFLETYRIRDPDQFYGAVRQIQLTSWLKDDGVIGRNTLEALYKEWYPKERKIPNEIKERISIDRQLQELYRGTKYQWLWDIGSLDHYRIWSRMIWYDYLESGLEKFISNSQEQNVISPFWEPFSMIVKNVWWMRRFMFYWEDWTLSFASSSSIWSGEKTEKFQWISLTWKLDIDKTSWQFEDAVMPYAVHVTRWIWVHWWAVWPWKTSQGCIRLPYNAAKKFYEIAEQEWAKNFKIYVL